jgi:xanthine dehydrogenase YagS FAD-binding subunit
MLYEIPQLELVQPETIEEATHWLSHYGDKAKIIAGGTDLLGLLKDNVSGPKFPVPEVLVDIGKIEKMRSITVADNQELVIGAGVTLSKLANSRLVTEKFKILAEAANSVATPQIRNAGTVGGNLCQRPWCWYFRNNAFPCFKKGGKQCYAIPGEHKYYFSTLGLGTCVMSHPSDLAPAFVALDASVTIAGSEGTRKIPISKFFLGPKDVFENVLKENEILTGVTVPMRYEEYDGVYMKDRIRQTWDLSLASAAVALKMSDGVCTDARICLGGVAPYPYRSEPAEEVLRGHHPDEESATKASDAAFEKSKPLPMTRYKVQIGKVILKRAINRALGF